MWEFLSNLFVSQGFMPHGHCYLWQPAILWTHVLSDSLIAAAYVSIPVSLVYFVRKRKDLPFNWMFLLFGVFILGCGLTHIVEVWTVWDPQYRLGGVMKAITALASIGTAVMLWPLIPKALLIPSPAQLREANRQLQAEVEERQRAQEELTRRAAELEAFTYTVSHDLRAPLRAMHGFADALLEDYGDQLGVEGQGYARRIRSAAQRMDALTQDLLAYSRLAQAEMPLAPVELDAAVAAAREYLAADLARAGATVEVPSGLPRVLAHEETLLQVLENLLSNALKFVAPGTAPCIAVGSETRGELLRLWVQDNGIGVPEEYRERIFRVFERLHAQETYPGTGIGLAIVAKGVERMGGRVGVEPGAAGGSRFWIEIPKAPPA